RAHEVAHVLDHTDHRHADALEHFGAAQTVADGHLLRRGHDDGAADVERLGERQLGVAGAGREIDQEVVELAPLHVPHELLDHLHDDGTAPDRRRVALHDQPERHDLYAVTLERLNLAAPHLGLLVHAHHAGNVGPVDVRIHEPDAVPLVGEG